MSLYIENEVYSKLIILVYTVMHTKKTLEQQAAEVNTSLM